MKITIIPQILLTSMVVLSLTSSAELGTWNLSGNANTNPAAHFIGTVDSNPVVLKTNNIEAERIAPGSSQIPGDLIVHGKVGVGVTEPLFKMQVDATDQLGLAIRGPQSGVGSGVQLQAIGGGGRGWEILATGKRAAQGAGKLNIRDLGDGSDDVTITREGNVGIGIMNPAVRLHVNGKAMFHDMTLTGGGDIAETFSVKDLSSLEPGSVMVIDEDNPGRLRLSRRAYDKKVAGVISGAKDLAPGLILQTEKHGLNEALIAMAGRVFCKAEALSSPIQIGDLLTTSHVAGHAMKASDEHHSHGAILGKAMSSLEAGTGVVLVLVNLH
jgi:hypothetical protein